MKQLKRIISFILFLILLINANSIASVGDASAFVTKEEFDNALSEFNRRLSVFEAGINSKIDSQVTSYLDRNGIWSRKEQTLKVTSLTPYGITLGAANAQIRYYSYYPGNNYSGQSDFGITVRNSGAYYLTSDTSSPTRDVLIEKIDKSGLMLFKYSRTYGAYNDYGFITGTAPMNAAKASEIVGDQVQTALITQFKLEEVTVDGVTNWPFTDVVYANYQVPVSIATINQTGVSKFFFVNKGSKLYYNCINQSTVYNTACDYKIGTKYYSMAAYVY